MKIPSTVNLHGVPYEVKVVPAVAATLETKYSATIDYESQIITIGEQAPAAMEISFYHECIHGMMHALGLAEHDEKLIDGLAHQLYLMVKDNPGMFAT